MMMYRKIWCKSLYALFNYNIGASNSATFCTYIDFGTRLKLEKIVSEFSGKGKFIIFFRTWLKGFLSKLPPEFPISTDKLIDIENYFFSFKNQICLMLDSLTLSKFGKRFSNF